MNHYLADVVGVVGGHVVVAERQVDERLGRIRCGNRKTRCRDEQHGTGALVDTMVRQLVVGACQGGI